MPKSINISCIFWSFIQIFIFIVKFNSFSIFISKSLHSSDIRKNFFSDFSIFSFSIRDFLLNLSHEPSINRSKYHNRDHHRQNKQAQLPTNIKEKKDNSNIKKTSFDQLSKLAADRILDLCSIRDQSGDQISSLPGIKKLYIFLQNDFK